jgi:RloB-like protein
VPRRDRPRAQARRTPFLDPRRRLLVVCEGEVTEPEYFEGFRRWCRNSRVEVRVEGPAGVPMSLVTKARDLREQAEHEAATERDENLRYDEVWCVFDRDEHPRVIEARQMAKDNGLRLAMSNACFELWLILHFRESPGAQHRHHLQTTLKELMPGVEGKHIDFERLIPGYDDAFRRAERLEQAAIARGEEGGDPTTEVFHLTDSIDEGGAQRRARPTRPDVGRARAEAAAAAAYAQAAREMEADPPTEE